MQLQIKKLIREIRKNHIILFSTHILQLATDLCDEIVVLNNGQLTQIDHELLKDPAFESRIITILSEDAATEDLPELQEFVEDAIQAEASIESAAPNENTRNTVEQKDLDHKFSEHVTSYHDGDA